METTDTDPGRVLEGTPGALDIDPAFEDQSDTAVRAGHQDDDEPDLFAMAPLDALNSYEGDNIWGDLILSMSGYDEDATDKVEHGEGQNIVIAGVHYHHDSSSKSWVIL